MGAHHGYYLRTTRDHGRHRLAGPRADHEDITFPVCPRCKFRYSPVLRLDFADPLLASLGLWTGDAVLMVCHNGCRPEAAPMYAWDYKDPRAPVILDPASIDASFGPVAADWEFEEIGLDLVPCDEPDPDVIDTETRVGGTPAWLQQELGFDDGEPEWSEPVIRCPRCESALPLLAQWSETNMEHVPRRFGPGRQQVMGEPFIRFWFGCAACRVIVTFHQID